MLVQIWHVLSDQRRSRRWESIFIACHDAERCWSLVHMNYQARLGIMAAGSYGLPQFRLCVFLWGAHPNKRLPQFSLPTHEVIVRYFPIAEFELLMMKVSLESFKKPLFFMMPYLIFHQLQAMKFEKR